MEHPQSYPPLGSSDHSAVLWSPTEFRSQAESIFYTDNSTHAG